MRPNSFCPRCTNSITPANTEIHREECLGGIDEMVLDIHVDIGNGDVPKRIVAAACLSRNRLHMIVGPRHWDPVMQGIKATYTNRINWATGEQGFIDQFGSFYNRTDAWKIAQANNQIIRRVGGDTADYGTLYSENLY